MAPRVQPLLHSLEAACAGELLRQGERELAHLRLVGGAYKRTARRIAAAMARIALAASLLGVPLAGTSWAQSDPCFAGGPRLDDRLGPSPELADIDGDGDLDAFIGEGFFGNTIFYRNTGTAAAAAFAAPQTNPFGLFNVGQGASPEMVDIDADGDLDAFIGASNGNTFFFRNQGTAAAPNFPMAETNPFNLSDVGYGAAPELVDIDGDGDLDALIGENNGSTLFFRNTGSSAAPAFATAQTNPFGLANVGFAARPELVDIDGDGSLDAFIGAYGGNTIFFRNSGTAASPAFAAPQTNPFGLINVGGSVPELVDIDRDGDLDALIGPSIGSWVAFRNVGTAATPAFATSQINPFGLIDVGQDANPDFVDFDGDGDLDAFIGVREGNTLHFRNTGTATAPAFQAPLTNPFGLVNIGRKARPEVVDIDGDSLKDAFIGEINGNTIFLPRLPGVGFGAPQTNPFGLADVGIYAAPELADIDGDGDLDAFVGGTPVDWTFFRNTGTAMVPAFAAPQSNPFGLVDVGSESNPKLADIDGDGDLDALFGNLTGTTIFFRNTGTAVAPAFAAPQTNPFGLANLGVMASPDLVDIDGDGDLDVFIGELNGNIVFFRNDCRPRADVAIDFGSSFGIWVWRNAASWVKIHGLSPASMLDGDLDRTGLDDLVIDFGSTYGVWLWRNGVAWEQLHGASPEAMVRADLDGNGKDEVLFDFGAAGVWVRRNDASWEQLHAASPEAMVAADLDGNGKDEVLFDFGAAGVWVRRNDVAWQQLHGLSPEITASADMDGSGRDELLLDFGAQGVWLWRNDTSWEKLHGLSPDLMASADVDHSGQHEVLLDFGPTYGVWIRRNDSLWQKLHGLSPEQIAPAHLDSE